MEDSLHILPWDIFLDKQINLKKNPLPSQEFQNTCTCEKDGE